MKKVLLPVVVTLASIAASGQSTAVTRSQLATPTPTPAETTKGRDAANKDELKPKWPRTVDETFAVDTAPAQRTVKDLFDRARIARIGNKQGAMRRYEILKGSAPQNSLKNLELCLRAHFGSLP